MTEPINTYTATVCVGFEFGGTTKIRQSQHLQRVNLNEALKPKPAQFFEQPFTTVKAILSEKKKKNQI